MDGDDAQTLLVKLFQRGPYWVRHLHKAVNNFLQSKIKNRKPVALSLKQEPMTPSHVKTSTHGILVTPAPRKRLYKSCDVVVADDEWKGKGPKKKKWFRGEQYNADVRGKRGAKTITTGTSTDHRSCTIDGLVKQYDMIVEGCCDQDKAEVLKRLIQDKSALRFECASCVCVCMCAHAVCVCLFRRRVNNMHFPCHACATSCMRHACNN